VEGCARRRRLGPDRFVGGFSLAALPATPTATAPTGAIRHNRLLHFRRSGPYLAHAHDRTTEAYRSAAQRQHEIALAHERFAEEHESAAESLPDELAEADRGAADDKHLQATDEDRR
jgi:hypothetical protein